MGSGDRGVLRIPCDAPPPLRCILLRILQSSSTRFSPAKACAPEPPQLLVSPVVRSHAHAPATHHPSRRPISSPPFPSCIAVRPSSSRLLTIDRDRTSASPSSPPSQSSPLAPPSRPTHATLAPLQAPRPRPRATSECPSYAAAILVVAPPHADPPEPSLPTHHSLPLTHLDARLPTFCPIAPGTDGWMPPRPRCRSSKCPGHLRHRVLPVSFAISRPTRRRRRESGGALQLVPSPMILVLSMSASATPPMILGME